MEEQEEETRVHQNKRLVEQTAFTTLGLIDDCDFVITFVVSFDRDSKVVTGVFYHFPTMEIQHLLWTMNLLKTNYLKRILQG